MIKINIKDNNQLFFYSIIFLIFFYVTIFILEVIYYLPSPYGDDLQFLKLSFNICRDNAFVYTESDIFQNNADTLKWITHGWFPQYLHAKLNLNCSLRGLYIFSFFTKLFTIFFLFFYLNKIKSNKIYSFIIILITLLAQLKLQFRPEAFVILLYSILFFYFEKKNYFITGFILSLVFFSQPTSFTIIGLIGFLIFFKVIKKNLLLTIFGFSVGFFLLIYIYPYSFIEYLGGLWGHRHSLRGVETLIDGGMNYSYIYNLYKYYVVAPFFPFLGIILLLLIFFVIKNKPILTLSLPLLFFFGPNSPSANYVLIGLIPFLILIYESLSSNKILNKSINSKFYIVILLISLLGLAQFFARNILTAIHYPSEILKTKEFLTNNINDIEKFPGFSFLLDEKLKFISMGEKNKNVDLYKYKVISVNGSINPCPGSELNHSKKQDLSILSFKIFNSNSGYGILICKK